MVDAKISERVDDRVYDRSRRGYGACLPGRLSAKRIARTWRTRQRDLHHRKIRGPRHGILLKACRDQLSGLIVVTRSLSLGIVVGIRLDRHPVFSSWMTLRW